MWGITWLPFTICGNKISSHPFFLRLWFESLEQEKDWFLCLSDFPFRKGKYWHPVLQLGSFDSAQDNSSRFMPAFPAAQLCNVPWSSNDKWNSTLSHLVELVHFASGVYKPASVKSKNKAQSLTQSMIGWAAKGNFYLRRKYNLIYFYPRYFGNVWLTLDQRTNWVYSILLRHLSFLIKARKMWGSHNFGAVFSFKFGFIAEISNKNLLEYRLN